MANMEISYWYLNFSSLYLFKFNNKNLNYQYTYGLHISTLKVIVYSEKYSSLRIIEFCKTSNVFKNQVQTFLYPRGYLSNI